MQRQRFQITVIWLLFLGQQSGGKVWCSTLAGLMSTRKQRVRQKDAKDRAYLAVCLPLVRP